VHAARIPASVGQLTGLMRAAFGSRPHLRSVTRLPGASKKGVYRAAFDPACAAGRLENSRADAVVARRA
jgi:hypothetical protein